MREASFIKQNKPRWEEFEKVVAQPKAAPPDQLAELFVQVTDDLSFSRTQYPNSRTTQYLNALATRIHLEIYKNKKEKTSRFITFWRDELPAIYYEARMPMLYAAIVFVISLVVGTVSALYDDTFVRLILGDGYVNMTLENIKEGNPTNVYASGEQTDMFFAIAKNNIQVSFLVFIYGIFFSLGTGFYLMYNGIMVGSFIAFFYREQALEQAFPVIMLHGTIELTSIVIAAGAGFTMGNALVFPGTYPRLYSFRMGAKKGMKMVVGLVPFFLLAAWIESFVTRYAFMHWSIKVLIIGLSALLMVYYFILYPKQKHNGNPLP